MTLRLRGSTSGYAEINAPAVAGDNSLTLPTTTGTVRVAGGAGVVDGDYTVSTGATIRGSTNAISFDTGVTTPIQVDSNGLTVGTGATIRGSSNTIRFDTGANPPVQIDSNGHVGIGTDNPAAKLEVATSVDGEATLAIFKNTSRGGTNETVDIKLGLENTTTSNVILRAGKEANHGSGASTDNFFAIHTTENNTSAERLRITSAGISQFAATGRVATFTGNGIEINNSLGSNIFIGTQSGAEGKMGTINNSNMALFANNDYTKRVELQTDGDFSILDGNLVVASGHGINFSAYATSGNPSSNLLDDYEEGTFTPTIQGSSNAGTASYTNNQGQYVKVGQLVTVQFYLAWNSGTGAGSLEIHNLPFSPNTIVSSYGGVALGYWHQVSLATEFYPQLFLSNTSNFIHCYQAALGGGTASVVPYPTTGGGIIASVTYRTT